MNFPQVHMHSRFLFPIPMESFHRKIICITIMNGRKSELEVWFCNDKIVGILNSSVLKSFG